MNIQPTSEDRITELGQRLKTSIEQAEENKGEIKRKMFTVKILINKLVGY